MNTIFSNEELEKMDLQNKIVFGQEFIQRKEDMSPDGSLMVSIQNDGDVVLTVVDSERECIASVEFCTPGTGGGGSPKTHKALRALIVAMVEDQSSIYHNARAGRFPVNDKVKNLIANSQ